MNRYPFNLNKKRFSIIRIIALLLIGIFIIPSNYSMALVHKKTESKTVHKEEVVYAKLTTAGSPSDVYVVNAFTLPNNTKIKDYGKYSAVQNLTNLDSITYRDNEVSIDTKKGRFYYQGSMIDKNLPWNIDIHYYLDGKEKTAEQMSGATGEARITIDTSKGNITDSSFFEKYMLQVSITLDTMLCSNISAKGATIANAGTNKMINFAAMPGKTSKLEVTADVENFSMPGISIAGVPFSIADDMVDMTQISQMADGLQLLANGISQLNNGANQLNTGINLFAGGTNQLANGYGIFNDGIKQMYSGSNDLYNGALQLEKGSSQYQDGFHKLSAGGNQLIEGSTQINNTLQELSSHSPDISAEDMHAILQGLKRLQQELERILPTLEDFLQQNPFQEITLSERNAALTELEIQKNEGNISERTLDVFKKLLIDYEIANCTNELVNGEHGIRDILIQFIRILDRFNSNVQIPENFDPNMIKQFAKEYAKFHSGLCQYVDGVNQLNQNYSQIHSGIKGLSFGIKSLSFGLGEASGGSIAMLTGIKNINDGAVDLSQGVNQLADGINLLNSQTSKLPTQVKNGIDDMMSRYTNSDFIPNSFTSEKNSKVDAVQFVFTTEEIKTPEKPIKYKEKKGHATLFEKFINLFK